MRRTFGVLLLMFVTMAAAFGQAKKPTIMVFPADAWCSEKGYMTQTESQGIVSSTPNYKEALQNDIDLLNVITKIGQLMTDRGFPLKDLASTISSLEQSSAENEMLTSSNLGATIAETPYEKLLNRAKADIKVEVLWKVNTMGPKSSVTYTLRGIDAYTNKQVAAVSGTGDPSFSAETAVLLEEAVNNNMNTFADQLQSYFDNMIEIGREVSLEVLVFDTGSGPNLETEFDGEMLMDIIDVWLYNNTVEHRYNVSDATENRMIMEQVRIPLYRTNGMPMDTRNFANELRKYLRAAPYNIDCKLLTKGLGKAVLVIGDK